MKRSNRLVLLIGVFLAIVAFVGILLARRAMATTTDQSTKPTHGAADRHRGRRTSRWATKITADQVKVEHKAVDARNPAPSATLARSSARSSASRSRPARRSTRTPSAGRRQRQDPQPRRPAGQRAIAVQVDQVTGVGTVIKTGDYVDMVVGFTADKFPVITVNPTDQSFTVVAGLNGTSVKVLLQGMQVLGTLLPPPRSHDDASRPPPARPTEGGSTALNGQQEIVILAVDAQQAEVIKFSQLDALDLADPPLARRLRRRERPADHARSRTRPPA